MSAFQLFSVSALKDNPKQWASSEKWKAFGVIRSKACAVKSWTKCLPATPEFTATAFLPLRVRSVQKDFRSLPDATNVRLFVTARASEIRRRRRDRLIWPKLKVR